MPLNRNLRVCWLVICSIVVAFWYKSFFGSEADTSTLCTGYVSKDKDASSNVPSTFKILAGCFFAQSVLMFTFQLY